jgi:hypothetical protein
MQDNGSGSGSGAGASMQTYPFSGRPAGGVYLRKLQFELPYSTSSSPVNRYKAQDLMIAGTSQLQDTVSTVKRDAGAAESAIWSRYGVAYKNWVDFITGIPEYLR